MFEKQKRYYMKHKENVLLQKKEYYQMNKEIIRKSQKEHYEKRKEQYRKHNQDRRRKWELWFIEHGYVRCERCGFKEAFCALDFHHKGIKEFNIAKFISSHTFTEHNKSILLEEISGCELLCANCHRIIHSIHSI